jgi:hypothetical protein
MKYEFLHETEEGVKIYARIDDDGLCRVTCSEDDRDYQEWLNPTEQSTPIASAE